MPIEQRFVHILDDLAMGGVTRALKNFEHPSLTAIGTHECVDAREGAVRAASKHDVALVHFTCNWKKLDWLLNLKLRGGFARIILIEHTYTEGFETSEVAAKYRFRLMLKLAYRLVDKVVAVSQAQRDWILQHKLAPAEKVIAIPQSRICDDLFDISVPKRSKGPLKIRAFGRFHKQKGFDLLVKAMARVPASVAELKIAGDGPEINHLRLLASDLDHVEICPPFESPNTFLSDAELIAIPSRWEAFGLVGTEARAAGRPMLAARVDGLKDQLDENSFGHAPNCVSSIVKGIYKSAAAIDLSERGIGVREMVAGEFDKMIAGWEGLLREGSVT